MRRAALRGAAEPALQAGGRRRLPAALGRRRRLLAQQAPELCDAPVQRGAVELGEALGGEAGVGKLGDRLLISWPRTWAVELSK